jgi:hypothetical protein
MVNVESWLVDAGQYINWHSDADPDYGVDPSLQDIAVPTLFKEENEKIDKTCLGFYRTWYFAYLTVLWIRIGINADPDPAS